MDKKHPAHVGPLRRSIRQNIAKENPSEEFEADKLPFRYLIGKSVDQQIRDIHWPPLTDDPDNADAIEIATRALVFRYVHFAHIDIYDVMETCESPIERTMLAALIAVAVKEDISLHLKGKHFADDSWPIEYGKHPSRFFPGMLTVTPQAQLGEYRVDFLLEYELIRTEYPEEAKHKLQDGMVVITKPELATHVRLQKNLIVECDGHDFHEKTKQQAARDKKRDRILQSLGYKVFRFTGSEIHNDAVGCALEVMKCFGTDYGHAEPINQS